MLVAAGGTERDFAAAHGGADPSAHWAYSGLIARTARIASVSAFRITNYSVGTTESP